MSRGMAVATLLAGALAAAPPPVWAAHCPDTAVLAAEIAALRDSDPAAGIERGEAAVRELQETRHVCALEEARLRGAIGSNLNILGRHDEAVAAFEQALALLGRADSPGAVVQATLHRGAGLAYYDSGRFDAALRHYLTALDASEAADDGLEAAKTAGNIGILYVTLGRLDTARDYHQRALRGFEAAGWKQGIAGTLINLGSLAAKFALRAADDGDAEAARGFNEELRDHNRQALALLAELGNRRGVAYAASNVGLAHDRLGQPAEALDYHQRALEARRAIGDAHGVIDSLVSMGASLTALERFDEAEARFAEAASMLPDDNPRLQLTVFEPWAALEAARGDPTAALARHRRVARLRADIVAADSAARIAEIQARHDSEQQRREIDELRYQRQLNELRLERQGTALAAAATLLVLLLVAVVAWQRRARRHASEMERAARSDELTGLANRRGVRDRIEYEIVRSRRSGRPFSLALVDLDGFKAINDKHGHQAGDRVLAASARRIESLVRRQDTVSRWGGDEMLVLLPETDEAGAVKVARKLADAFAATGTDDEGGLPMTLTIGVAQYWPGATLDDCVRAADGAMYRGKQAGRNRVVTSRE